MKHLTILTLFSFLAFTLSGQQTSSEPETGRAFLGITTTEIDDNKAGLLDLPTDEGAYVTRVYPGLAADQAGIRPFDYIIALDGEALDRRDDLSSLLQEHRPGDEVDIELIRSGMPLTVRTVLGDRQNYTVNWDYNVGDAFLGVSEHHDDDEDEMGVMVNVTNGAAAQAMGLRHGDIITALNGQPIADWEDISIAINNMAPGEEITVNYMRVGQPRRTSGTIGSKADPYQTKQQERGYLGIYSGDMDEEKAAMLGFASPNGSYITKVLVNSAAQQAGLEVFDYVIGIDEYRVGEDMDLTDILHKYRAGEEVTVHFIRRNELLSARTTLGRASDSHSLSRPCQARPFFGVSPDHDQDMDRGVSVNVVDNSSAAAAGLQNGDVVMAINDYPVIDWQDLSTAINAMEVGETITVDVMRREESLTLSTPIGSECDESGEESWPPTATTLAPAAGGMAPLDRPVDMDRIQVTMEDMDENEANAMRERGVDMPLVNNLRIEALTLYPNPNRGMFRLEFELPERGPTSIRVFNSDARLIYSFDLGEYSGAFSDEIDISQNGPGAYFLEVRQGNTSMVKKVLLQY
jgi:S1-C subfamily serine protease